MNKKRYDLLEEEVIHTKLANGLNVYIIPKNDFNSTYAIFATKYGSIDNKFIPLGGEDYVEMPLGIAHFLEHTLFDMPNGPDAITLLSNLGVQANAFTDYTKTAYLFNATDNFKEALEILLDFVQTPFFTEENVRKEQGIIDQEIKMYLDVPRERLVLGVLQNMFKRHYIREDIAGTVESIQEITVENLQTVYETFYHPANMALVICGKVNLNETLDLIKENQARKEYPNLNTLKREYLCEDNVVHQKYGEVKMDVLMPKVAVGLKLPFKNFSQDELLKNRLMFRVLLEYKFGPTSTFYQELMADEIIDNTYSYSYLAELTAGALMFATDTNKDGEFVNRIQNKLLSLKTIDISKKDFDLYKRAVIGSFIRSFNNIEFIANSCLQYLFKKSDVFKTVEIMESLTLADFKKLENSFTKDAITVFKVLPSNFKK